jgi:uncharacterized protein (DUF2344 family)
MEKRNIVSLIETFNENQSSGVPDTITTKMRRIEDQIKSLSDEQVELETNRVVTAPAGEQPYNPDHIVYLLDDVHSELEGHLKNIKHDDSALVSLKNQLRGMLDIPERDFP